MNPSVHKLPALRIVLGALAFALGVAGSQAATVSGFDVNLVGSATIPADNTVRLTPATGGLAGAVWTTNPVSTALDFASNFEFTIKALGSSTAADGLAFVIQATGIDVIGSGGGGVGLQGLDAIAFVIHTWDNNQVGLTFDGNPFTLDNPTAMNLGAASVVTGSSFLVNYYPSFTTLAITGEISIDGGAPVLVGAFVDNIDLAARFGPSVYVGFTAATGLGYAEHTITGWTVDPTPVPEPGTYGLLLAGFGLICLKLRRRT